MWLIRMLEAQPVGDLLGRVLLLQPLRNLTSQPPVSDQPADPGPTGLLVGTTPRLTRPVAAAPTVAVDLPGDRRGRPAKLGRDVRETASCGHTEPDIFTLVDRQPRSWHLTHLRLGNDTLVVQRAVALQPLPERGGRFSDGGLRHRLGSVSGDQPAGWNPENPRDSTQPGAYHGSHPRRFDGDYDTRSPIHSSG